MPLLQVLPLTAAKEVAIKTGVAALLGNGMQASDISLTEETGTSQVRLTCSPSLSQS